MKAFIRLMTSLSLLGFSAVAMGETVLCVIFDDAVVVESNLQVGEVLLKKVPLKDDQIVNYRLSLSKNEESGSLETALLFSVEQKGEVLMASPEEYSMDGETKVVARAQNTKIQHALSTRPELKTIQSVYDAGLVRLDEPWEVSVHCDLKK